MNWHRICVGLILAVSCAARSQDVAHPVVIGPREESLPPPLKIRFNSSHGL